MINLKVIFNLIISDSGLNRLKHLLSGMFIFTRHCFYLDIPTSFFFFRPVVSKDFDTEEKAKMKL